MSDTVIKVENLGKKYLIRHQQRERYVALRDVLTNKFISFGKRLISLQPHSSNLQPTREEFWALKDVSFEVKQGDRIGIIGRNGAGKTTLLKLLSRITEPTSGRIRIKGRVASLLEVGTGFHPELTGRENIFLNGAILGMTKSEIRKKFDEIVDFAEVETFLDTPVKRYSSGMYVRLAFAVAAHLELEILLVDEVLAVGDAQFQKKCLGKMGEVTKEGRTVLFVSHNMGAVQQFCNKCILLERGEIGVIGAVSEAVSSYSKNGGVEKNVQIKRVGNGKIRFESFELTDENRDIRNDFFVGDSIVLCLALSYNASVTNTVIGIDIKSIYNENFAHIVNMDDNFVIGRMHEDNKLNLKVKILNLPFTPSRYMLSLWVGEDIYDPCDYLENCIFFNLVQGEFIGRSYPYPSHVKTYLRSKWEILNE